MVIINPIRSSACQILEGSTACVGAGVEAGVGEGVAASVGTDF